jgi:glutamate 5-kinase
MKRIVIKIGTNLLTNTDYTFNKERITAIAADIAGFYNSGNDVIIITSGAIISGAGKLGLKTRPKNLPEKQACAAIGQPLLMHAYHECFIKHGIPIAQILLTREDFDNKTRNHNIRDTILTLLKLRVIPIINENDTVSVEEIKFGDNDTLSAIVGSNIESDMLIILTDVAGLFDSDPNINKNAKLITEVKSITKEIESLAVQPDNKTGKGTGGMYTKIRAAKISCSNGVETVITDGRIPGILTKILSSGKREVFPGTRFCASKKSGQQDQ